MLFLILSKTQEKREEERRERETGHLRVNRPKISSAATAASMIHDPA
jgi:hypothetical protein